MKTMKKIASIALALVLMLALCVPAMAAEGTENPELSVPETSTRSYDIYQIFTGSLADGHLGDVKWGQNGTGETGTAVDGDTLAALEAVNVAGQTDTEKLAVIKQYVNLDSEAFATINAGESKTVAPGYYLIKDNGPATEGGSISLYAVEVTENVTIKSKTSDTKLEKGVKDKNDSTGDETPYQASADYDVNDTVPFQLKATLGDRVSDYETYKVVFTDTLSDGLTLNANSIKVYIGSDDKTEDFTITTADHSFTVSCDDVKALGATNNSVITVEYTATLNENAVVGGEGNSNKATLQYSNDPNNSGKGHTPGGKTPEQVAVVFTLKAIVNKVQPNPDYNPEVEGSQKFIPLDGAGFTLYKYDAALENEDGTKGGYVQVGNELKTGHQFTFSGLDDGDYMLKETTTPAGYNTIADIYFTITAEHTVEGLTKLEAKNAAGEDVFTGDLTAGSLTGDVENSKGSLLPETGGIGTTIFYVVGATLVLAAGILLITKKRMGAN